MEEFIIPEILTRQVMHDLIERLFAVYAPNDEMRTALLLFADNLKPFWTMKHLVKYMDERNWSFPTVLAQQPPEPCIHQHNCGCW